MKKHPMQLLLG